MKRKANSRILDMGSGLSPALGGHRDLNPDDLPTLFAVENPGLGHSWWLLESPHPTFQLYQESSISLLSFYLLQEAWVCRAHPSPSSPAHSLGPDSDSRPNTKVVPWIRSFPVHTQGLQGL